MKGQSHCCFIITDVSVVIIVAMMIIMMSVKALMFKRGRGQSKLPGPVLNLGTSGLGASCSVPINLDAAAALHFCKVWFWFSVDQRYKGFTVKD